MALSGSKSVQCTPNVDLVFSWTAVQDKQAKTSTVSWVMKLVANSVGSIEGTPGSPYTVTVDGEEYSGTTHIAVASNSTRELASGQKVMSHNADGTRSFEYSFSQVCNITLVGGGYVGTVSGSGSGVLNTIVEETPEEPEEPDNPDPEEPDEPEEPEVPVKGIDKRSFLAGYMLGRTWNPNPIIKGGG